jgi:hypothetical protein
MRALFPIVFLFPFIAMAGEGDFYPGENNEYRDFISYSVKKDSWLSLSGTTNINAFECLSNGEIIHGYILVDAIEEGKRINFSEAGLVLDVSSFDCKNQMITRDMHKALGGSQAPGIGIQLLDAKAGEINPDSASGNILTNILITINNISGIKQMDIAWSRTAANEFQFEGMAELSMKDFNIDPPSPVMGLVKVNDTITVNFNYSVQAGPISRLD